MAELIDFPHKKHDPELLLMYQAATLAMRDYALKRIDYLRKKATEESWPDHIQAEIDAVWIEISDIDPTPTIGEMMPRKPRPRPPKK